MTGETPTSPSTPPPGPAERRISILTGDRLCASCGYNLVGQSVIREPHYELLIIRCPECGEVAAAQEYPRLGRWASRWSIVLSALWFVVVLAIWAGSSLAVFAFCAGAGNAAHGRFQDRIQKEYRRTAEIPEGANWWDGYGQWLEMQDTPQLIAQAGGLAQVIDPLVFFLWIPMFLVLTAIGVIWSAVLLPVRRSRLPLFSLVILALAGAFLGVLVLSWWTDEMSSAWQRGMGYIATPVAALSWIAALIPLCVGLFFGRSILRLFIRALLPPRLRGPLAGLWTVDGLPPPRP